MARTKSAGGPLAVFGTVRSLVSILREMSFDDIKREAERAPRLLVVGPNAEAASGLGQSLTGEIRAGTVMTHAANDLPRDLGLFDAAVVHDPTGTGATDRVREQLGERDDNGPVFRFEGANAGDQRGLEELRLKVMQRLPDRAPAFGRAFPAFRPSAAKATIDEAAKANAQFALVSNIPAVVPFVGGLVAASADFLVLTKNQVMLLYKVAAIHGRSLDDQFGIIREMVPVVGAGLAWRTVAREIAAFIPFAAGTVPKVAVAYAGTLAAGRGADYYYRFGHKPDPAQIKGYYQQAADRVRSLPFIPDAIPAGSESTPPPERSPASSGDNMPDQPTAPVA
ncbi:MAG: hypothetical protein M3P94_02250 [Chloroflexota bacterium]|nr:hypothetical protein [Chloroflexota bacterium]